VREDFVFFWGSSSPFSNWYPSPFIHDDVDYNCSEQFMMAAKAKLFDDPQSLKKIMNTNSPREQKAYGRMIKNFNQDWWMLNCIDIMVPALVNKFLQNPDCRDAMANTGTKEIVEASPVDAVWGIGLSASNPLAWEKETWQGKNLLGVCLMRTRAILPNG
jgi:ribA/ribD-fused uncharacterized protein